MSVKYLCLIFIDEKKYDAMHQSEQAACVKEHLAYDNELRKSGHLIVTEALQSVKNATTVRVRDGKGSVIDGPFAETKEQSGGFYFEARDLNDAIPGRVENPVRAYGQHRGAADHGIKPAVATDVVRASRCVPYASPPQRLWSPARPRRAG